MKTATTWKLAKGGDRRIRAGHPWVFSNQLSHSPKGIEPGTPVELLSDRNEFLAYGYGNPHSLIAFRVLSFDRNTDFFSTAALIEKILSSWTARQRQGFTGSFRIVFSEADGLPGLVLDRFQLDQYQVLAFQVLTAGMETWLGDAKVTMEKMVSEAKARGLCSEDWQKTFLVERKDTSIRKLEGLNVEEPRCLHAPSEVGEVEHFLENARVQVHGGAGEKNLYADLLSGQKTGFFLDQSLNMLLVQQVLAKRPRTESTFRILDLCCYVGHWSLQMASLLKERGIEAEVDLVDVSQGALTKASRTLTEAGIAHRVHEVDVMKDVGRWPAGEYDLLIVDPPAFVKSKKDLATGEHAYVKINTEAFKRARDQALVVSCSCSGLVDEELFSQTVAKALRRSGRQGTWLLRGGQGFDHPVLPSFPEGKYLKMILTEVRSR